MFVHFLLFTVYVSIHIQCFSVTMYNKYASLCTPPTPNDWACHGNPNIPSKIPAENTDMGRRCFFSLPLSASTLLMPLITWSRRGQTTPANGSG